MPPIFFMPKGHYRNPKESKYALPIQRRSLVSLCYSGYLPFLWFQSSTEQGICHALWVASIAARTSAALGMDFPAP